MKKITLPLLLILLLSFGYIIALHSTHAAMAADVSGNSDIFCLNHCLDDAATLSQDTAILPTILTPLVTPEYDYQFFIPLASYIPYYQFTTVILKE